MGLIIFGNKGRPNAQQSTQITMLLRHFLPFSLIAKKNRKNKFNIKRSIMNDMWLVKNTQKLCNKVVQCSCNPQPYQDGTRKRAAQETKQKRYVLCSSGSKLFF